MTLSTWRIRSARTLVAASMAAGIVLFLATAQADAHKVNVFAYVEGDRVMVEGYFTASVKAQDCAVEVFDHRGEKIHEGKTDQKGVYSFKLTDLPTASGGLRIVLEAGMGHKAEYTLSASDIPGSAGKEFARKEPPSKGSSEEAPVPAVAGPVQDVDQAALIAALETVLDRKLEPIVRALGRQEKLFLEQKYGGPRMTDIVGGLGWIMGLVGLTAFFWARSRAPKGPCD